MPEGEEMSSELQLSAVILLGDLGPRQSAVRRDTKMPDWKRGLLVWPREPQTTPGALFVETRSLKGQGREQVIWFSVML